MVKKDEYRALIPTEATDEQIDKLIKEFGADTQVWARLFLRERERADHEREKINALRARIRAAFVLNEE